MTGAFAVPDTRRNGYVVDPRFFPALNSAFLDDGDGALNALAVAVDWNTRAVWSAQKQAAQLAAQQRAEQAEREKAEEEKRREQEMHEVMQRMLSRSSREDDTEQEDKGAFWKDFALAGAVVIAFVGVLKFAGGLA